MMSLRWALWAFFLGFFSKHSSLSQDFNQITINTLLFFFKEFKFFQVYRYAVCFDRRRRSCQLEILSALADALRPIIAIWRSTTLLRFHFCCSVMEASRAWSPSRTKSCWESYLIIFKMLPKSFHFPTSKLDKVSFGGYILSSSAYSFPIWRSVRGTVHRLEFEARSQNLFEFNINCDETPVWFWVIAFTQTRASGHLLSLQ